MKILAVLLSFLLSGYGCAVTGPRVTRQEEDAARSHLQRGQLLTWWYNQKKLLRVADRLAWGVNVPEAKYRTAFGVIPALRKAVRSDQSALLDALGNRQEGLVLHVSVGSPVERAGISEGDVIVSIDNRDVSTFSLSELQELSANGMPRQFSIKKRGENAVQTVTITPGRVLDITFLANPSEEVNAAAGPQQGRDMVVVNYGMLNFVQNDDELAVLLGHEMVHILKGHSAKSSVIGGIGALIGLGLAVVGAARGVDASGAVRGVSDLTRITQRGFSRDYEREADYLGMHLAHQAGFNVDVATIFWERFASSFSKSLTANYLSTHPSSAERFVRIQKTQDEIREGRELQDVWFGKPSESQVAAETNQQSPPAKIAHSASMANPAHSQNAKSSSPVSSAVVPAQQASRVGAANQVAASDPLKLEDRGASKSYASLVQYDGPKIKSGITLEAEFLDEGAGRGSVRVIYPGNRYLLTGKFVTSMPGEKALG